MTDQNLLFSIVKIIYSTPSWVWIVLGYLIFIGIRATKPRLVYIPKLFIIPVVLSGLKYKIFMDGTLFVWMGYFICLFLSSFLSFKYSSTQKIKIIKGSMYLKLPGTYWTLVVLMSFFTMKYIFGYISAIQTALYQELQVFEVSMSGLFSGYFLGKAINYLTLLKKESIWKIKIELHEINLVWITAKTTNSLEINLETANSSIAKGIEY